MKTYQTTAIVEPDGTIRLASVPFSAGTEVKVAVSSRSSAEEFPNKWEQVCRELRGIPQLQHAFRTS